MLELRSRSSLPLGSRGARRSRLDLGSSTGGGIKDERARVERLRESDKNCGWADSLTELWTNQKAILAHQKACVTIDWLG